MTAPSRSLLSALETWLHAGGSRVGEIIVRPVPEGYCIRHHLDAEAAGTLRRYATPEDAREIAKYDAAGKFRPLKSAPTLMRGWELVLPDVAALREALDFLYPAALANWIRWLDGEAVAPTLRETLGRQTGIYRVTGLIRDGEAAELVAGVCQAGCLRHILWPLNATTGWENLPPEKQTAPADGPEAGRAMPLLCLDACPLLVGGAREAVKRRMKAEKEGT